MSGSDERIYPPTARKRTSAREQGQIARSRDLQLGCFLLMLTLVIHWSIERFPSVAQTYLRTSLEQVETQSVAAQIAITSKTQSHFGQSLGYFLLELWPIWILPVAAALAMFLQIGPFFRPQLAAPDVSRFAPGAFGSRLFSPEIIFRFLSGTIKLAILSTIAWNWIQHSYQLNPSTETLPEAWQQAGSQTVGFLLALSLGLIAWGVVDYLWQRWQLERQLTMTADEMREEQRQTNSRPQPRTASGQNAGFADEKSQNVGEPQSLERVGS